VAQLMHIIFQALYKVWHESVKGTNMSLDGHQHNTHAGDLFAFKHMPASHPGSNLLSLPSCKTLREKTTPHFLTHTHISLIRMCHLESHCGQFISRKCQTKSKDAILDKIIYIYIAHRPAVSEFFFSCCSLSKTILIV